jgi:WD40 repeat protein
VTHRFRGTSCVKFSPGGKTFVTGDLNGSVVVWDAATFVPMKSRSRTRIGGGAVRFSGDGKRLAIGGLTGCISLQDARSRTPGATIGQFTDSPITALTLSPNGESLAALPQSGSQIAIYRPGRPFAPPWGDVRSAGAIEISPDGSSLAVVFGCSGPKTQIVIWNLETGREVWRLPNQPSCDNARAAFSPDGKLLAVGIGNVATVWDVITQRSRATLPAHSGNIARVAFSPNGKLLATVGESDRTVRLFDVDRWERPAITFAHSASVTALAFAPESRTVVVGGTDGKLRFFKVRTGHEVMTLEGHAGGVADLAFAPDGSILVTSGKSSEGSGEVFFWYGRSDAFALGPEK